MRDVFIYLPPRIYEIRAQLLHFRHGVRVVVRGLLRELRVLLLRQPVAPAAGGCSDQKRERGQTKVYLMGHL